jgi:peptidoglycan hydrolase-like protein with peptidoglycan-binding domain
MRQRASSRKHRDVSSGGILRAAGAMIARNPVAVGGATAFMVTFSFVSANALWYQPHGHRDAFFATRALNFVAPPPARPTPFVRPAPQPRPPADLQSSAPPPASADPTIREVQEILTDLRLYAGPVDGISGPVTRDAIAHYQRVVGLEPTGRIDDALLRHLGATGSVAAKPPVPEPRPKAPEMTAAIPDGSGAARPAEAIAMRIQAGLRAFGNDQIEIDGIVGAKTEAAIREFQSLFGLPVTGKADPSVLAKMRDLGLAD